MIDVKNVIKNGLECFPMSTSDEDVYYNFLHDIKNMVIDMQNIKCKMELLGQYINDEPILRDLETKMNVLHLEHANLKNLLEEFFYVHQARMKIPHRCPVCHGSPLDGEMCIPCDGRGIVWS